MKKLNCFCFFILMMLTIDSWAYGSSSSSKSCAKPEFNNFSPTESIIVAPGADFSFIASANTSPNSLKVTVKGLPTTLKIIPRNEGGFQVSGKLPVELQDVFARIAITAEGQNNCKGESGWLVKISK